MKVLEILQNLQCGTVITDKRVLSVLKRNGLIFDYSQWGYLESQNVYYKDVWDNKEHIEHDLTYYGPAISDDELGSHDNPFNNREEMVSHGFFTYIYNMQYKGYTFESKYLDGCFNAYLILVKKPDTDKKEVNPRMSVFGTIVF